MRLFEHQAKELLRQAGVATPRGTLAHDGQEAVRAAGQTGYPCVLKPQLQRGGRGRAGLIRFARDEAELRREAAALFRTLPAGRTILVEERIEASREVYLSVSVEPRLARALVMACGEGGADIEEVAARSPQKILREAVPLGDDLPGFLAANIGYDLGFRAAAARHIAAALKALHAVFRSRDAELVEVNPLLITADDRAVAADAKIVIDDASLYRQPDFPLSRDYFQTDVEYEAARLGIPCLQFQGDIGLMCAGAGLANTVYDLVHDAGGSVSSYLEFGGPNYGKAAQALELCLRSGPRVVLVVTFGTIARADVMAEGLVETIRSRRPGQPIVACIRGTNEERAFEILQAAGLEPLSDTEEAVRRAVALAAGGGR